jgi:hypothetical protein
MFYSFSSSFSYRKDIKIWGIIYLHRISDNRVPASALKNIRTLEAMCGVSAMRNVALVTTMWNEVQPDVAQRREACLFEEFWSQMLSNGARAHRFKDSFNSAWDIADSLLRMPPAPTLHVSVEQVHHNKHLYETQAGIPLAEPGPKKQRGLSNKIGRMFSKLLVNDSSKKPNSLVR